MLVYFLKMLYSFHASASLLQYSVSHDPSEVILIYWFQETFIIIIIINVENSCAA